MRALLVVLLPIICLGGCTTFDSIERGVCGNGLLEPGEDCDTTDATCVACQVTCAKATECPTAAYACGTDGVCHAPAGRLGVGSSPQPFPVDDVAVTDIDRDGIGDVLGVSKTSLEVHYGDPSGALASTDQILTPIQGGVSAIADIDGDGALDVAFGTSDGVVVYTSPYGKLVPLAGRQPVGIGSLALQTMFPIDTNAFGLVAANTEVPATLELVVGSTLSRGAPIGATTPANRFCGGKLLAASFQPNKLDVYIVQDVYFAVEALVVVSGATGNGQRMCVTDVGINLITQTVAFTDVTPAVLQTTGTQGRGILARIDGDPQNPCPSLVINTLASGNIVTYAGSKSGTCGFAASATPVAIGTDLPSAPSSGATIVGHVPLSPTPFVPLPLTLTLATWGRDGIVTTDGVYGVVTTGNAPTKVERLFTATRPMDKVHVGDFNGDGSPDLVSTTDGEDDLDILFRKSFSFAPYRVDSATRPISSLVGDFDGNGVSDVAFIEPIEGHQRLSIAYGTKDQIAAPVELGAFKSVIALATIGIPTSLDQSDTTDDIAVIDQPDTTGLYLTLLRGSAQRTMLSYFDPRSSENPPASVAATLDGVVIGRFHDPTPSAVVIGDVTTTGHAGITAWPMAIDATSGLVPLTDAYGKPTMHLAQCTTSTSATTEVCMPDTKYVVWPTTGGLDAILAIDRQAKPSAALIDATPSVTLIPLVTAQVPATASVRSMHVVDLDGDGANELLVSFGTDSEKLAAGSVGLVELCPMDSGGHPTGACTDLGAQLDGKPTCIDAAPGHFSPADPTSAVPGMALALLCYGKGGSGIYRVTKDGSGYHGALVADGLGNVRAIQLGDVTGDGIDDAIVLQGGPGAESLVIYPQCTSTQPGCGL